jgi:FlaA1/EpsC-like NDP-sugar epimerase
VEKRHIEEMIIAIPSASSGQMRSIVERCRNAKVSFKTVPPLIDILNARVSMREVRGIRVDDLLGREPVHLDDNLIRSFVSGKRVLVTGAAGSIGSEICRQTARYNPDILIMLDRAENELYKLDIEIRSRFPEANRATEITDIRDSNKLDLLMSKTRPDVVFHAAAYKQVPLMEFFPEEAVMNNIIGTKTVAECAIRNRVSSFVMISTDKAVRPSSVMGASKRIAEMLVTSLSRTSDTKFVTVRFGNVLGSHGSVVELFTYQIEHSGPVTVTHPQVTRYFMTIKEATLLVMMAGAIGRNGQLMVLKMGEQVKIVDLARDMITLAGLVPDVDVPIEFVGLRPGEKLHEELFVEEEGILPSLHPKIMIATSIGSDDPELATKIDRLKLLASEVRRQEVIEGIRDIVPSFVPASQTL